MRLWTDEDKKWLAWWWGTYTLAQIAKRLKRSKEGVYQQARKLKLGMGKPRGYKNLDELAAESGFSKSALTTIFQAQGVALRRKQWSCPRSTKGRSYHRIVVEEERAMAAIHAWMGMEVLSAAAKRLGIGAHLLRAQLLREGHKPPPANKFWYLPSDVLESAAERARALVRGKQNKWSDYELAYLREHWSPMLEQRQAVARHLGRPIGPVKQRAQALGLNRSPGSAASA